MRRLLLTASLLILLAVLGAGGAAAAIDRTGTVRFVSKPTKVVQGGVVRAVVAVSPAGVRCTAILGRGTSGTAKLATARAGRATFTWTLGRAAAPGRWKISALCGRAGTASTTFTVATRTFAPAPIPARVVVDKSGFGYVDEYGFRELGYGIVLRNASPDQDAFNVQITVNVVDGANRILKSESSYIAMVPASSPYYFGGRLSVNPNETPAKLEITVRVGEGKKKALPLPPVSNLRVFDSGYGSIRVAGEFSNPYTKPMSSIAYISIVLFDAAGSIIGGGFTFPSAEVPPGGRIGFETSAAGVSDISRIASVQASVEADVGS
ncbi:MAG TPA: hypothetical protein VNJ54_16295 [Plantibacter sp.]|uniref:hypothetical protein n=1 Tax=Plantibacter sp. TaxID=1871045 RepID=UPI002B9D2761|nr:hypothetical protein [Plantibacter sp.]